MSGESKHPGTVAGTRVTSHESPVTRFQAPHRGLKVAIIGAGYAGMAAAVTVAEDGAAVTVYEAGPVPGGRARRIAGDASSLDNGIHILIGAYRDLLALMNKVGVAVDDALLRLPLDWTMHQRFRFAAAPLPAPWHLAAGLLAVRGAPWSEKIAAARWLSRLRRHGWRIEHDVSVCRLLQDGGQGPAFTRALWTPLCLAALNTPPERASGRVFLNVLRDGLDAGRAGSETLLTRIDFTRLFPDPAADFVRARGGAVHLRTPVRRIVRDDAHYVVETAERRDRYDRVICATSPHHAGALLSALPELAGTVAQLARFEYEPITTIYLQYAGHIALPQPMLGLIGRTADWLFDREAIAGARGLVGAVISASGAGAALDRETLARRVADDVAYVVGRTPELARWQVITEKRATFACTVDLVRPSCTTASPGLFLAGDYVASDYPATLEAAVRNGIAAARAALD